MELDNDRRNMEQLSRQRVRLVGRLHLQNALKPAAIATHY